MVILEEGLRYELLITISDQLDKSLRFSSCTSFKDVEHQLMSVGENLDSLKCSVEYIQDLVCVYGLKIWYDEYNKLVSTYIDIEWNYIRTKELPDEALKWASSQNQDSVDFTSQIKTKNLKKSENSLTFLGRVINALLIYSDGRKYSYIPQTLSFYDESEKGGYSVTMNTFGLVRKCIGVNGMHGIDKLLSFMLVSEMYYIQDTVQKMIIKDKSNLNAESTVFGSLNNTVKGIDKYYSTAKKRLKPQLDMITSTFEKIGHLAILRIMSLNELKISARKDSQKLYMLIEAMNDSYVNEMNYADDNLQKKEIDAQNAFMKDLIKLSLRVGFSDPLQKIYFKPKSIDYIPLIIAYCIYNMIGEIQWDSNLSMITRNRKKSTSVWDPIRILMGVHIYMNQYTEDSYKIILYYLAQYIRSTIGNESEKKKEEIQEAKDKYNHMVLLFIQLSSIVDIDTDTLDHILPISLLQYQSSKYI